LIKKLEIFTDGACSGNPGIAGIGVVVKEKGKIVKKLSQAIGEATNNIAEYSAVVYGLQEALIKKADEVVIKTDSELLFNQLTGNYKVKNQNIKPLFEQIKHLATGFKDVKILQVPRAQNKEADELAKASIKSLKKVSSRDKSESCDEPSQLKLF